MNSRTRALLLGSVFGALIGVLAGWLYYNSNVQRDEEGQEQLALPSPGASLRLGLGLLGVLRLITE